MAQLDELVRAVTVKPDDVLVFSTSAFLKEESRAFIHEDLKRVFPNNENIIVDGGSTLTVLQKE